MHIYIGNTELLPLSEMNSRCSSSGSSRRRRHLPAPQSVSRGQKNAWQQPPPRQEDAALVFPTVFFVLLSFHPTLSLSLSLFCKHGHECKFTCARHHSGIFHLLSCLEDAQSQRGMLEGKKKKTCTHPLQSQRGHLVSQESSNLVISQVKSVDGVACLFGVRVPKGSIVPQNVSEK